VCWHRELFRWLWRQKSKPTFLRRQGALGAGRNYELLSKKRVLGQELMLPAGEIDEEATGHAQLPLLGKGRAPRAGSNRRLRDLG
jgi:hypothetical protein